MRGRLPAGLAALLVIAGCAARRPEIPAPRPADRRAFDVPDCDARVELPGVPRHTSEQRTGDAVYRRIDTYEVVLGVGYGYIVSCLREPGDALRGKSPDALLDDLSQGRSTRGALKATDSRAISAGSCHAREEASPVETNRVRAEVTSRTYVAGDRAWMLVATSPDDALGRRYADRFLASFRSAVCDAPR
jgi:hypothetical protein